MRARCFATAGLVAVLSGCERDAGVPTSDSTPVEAPAARVSAPGRGEKDVAFPLSGLTREVATEALDCRVTGLGRPLAPDEPQVLAANPGRAMRRGAQLQVGRWSFQSESADPNDDAYPRFAYQGRYADYPIDTVMGEYGGEGGWIMLDQETGDRIEVAALPVPSPNGRLFAFPMGDTLELRERSSGSWKVVGAVPVRERTCDLRWVSDTELTLREGDDWGKDQPAGVTAVRVIRTETGWRRAEGPPDTD